MAGRSAALDVFCRSRRKLHSRSSDNMKEKRTHLEIHPKFALADMLCGNEVWPITRLQPLQWKVASIDRWTDPHSANLVQITESDRSELAHRRGSGSSAPEGGNKI